MALTAALIVRNEGQTIERCLSSCQVLASSFVIVDTGSVPSDPCRSFATTHYVWHDDFAAARNYAWAQVETDWALSIDGDEVLTPLGQKVLADIMRTPPDRPTLYRFDMALDTEGNVSKVIRFAYKPKAFRWVHAVHELLAPTEVTEAETSEGWQIVPVATKSPVMAHIRPASKSVTEKGRNLHILQKMYDAGDRTARTLWYLGREYQWNGCEGKAVAALEEYLTVHGDRYPEEATFAMLSISECYRTMGMHRLATSWALRALRLREWRECYVAHGLAIEAQGNLHGAFLDYEDAFEAGQTETILWTNRKLGEWIQGKLTQLTRALAPGHDPL